MKKIKRANALFIFVFKKRAKKECSKKALFSKTKKIKEDVKTSS